MVALSVTVGVGVAAPKQPAKTSLVLGMAAVTLWALATFLMNLAAWPGEMKKIGDLFAFAWCAVPYLTLRAALQYHRSSRRIGPVWRSLLLVLPAFGCLALEALDLVSADYIPARLNQGAFDILPTDWQLAVNAYFLLYFGAAGLILWRSGVLANTERVRRTALFFLALALPGVIIGSWSSGGLSLVEWRPPFLDTVIASGIIAALGWGMLREVYFKPRTSLEDARWAAEERLKNLLRVSPDCLGVVDLDGRFRLINLPAAQMLGYESVEACLEDGKRIDDFVPKEEHHLLPALRSASITGEVLLGAPLPIERPSGERIDTEVSVSLLHSASGEPDGFVASLRDVSARRRLEEGMRQAQKLESLGLLATGIAHDFNNLLSVVIGSSDLALAASRDNEEATQNIRQTLRGAKQLAALTRELLVYSGRARQVVGPLSLSRLVEEIGGLLEVSLPRQVTLETSLSKTLPRFSGDATQIQQVVLNLITNAAEASAEANSGASGQAMSVVHLTTCLLRVETDGLRDAGSGQEVPAGEYLCLRVRDTGCGIGPEAREKIFDPFYTSKVAGRGLGLSAVLGIVRDHQGFTLLESTLNEGTTFQVLLPPTDAPDNPEVFADIV